MNDFARNGHLAARSVALAALLLLTGCGSFAYDLASLPYPVLAGPNTDPTLASEPFELRGKHTLYLHGWLGETQPAVDTLVREAVGDARGVANFRVQVAASLHDWVITHLTLGIVRLKTVTIRGERLSAR